MTPFINYIPENEQFLYSIAQRVANCNTSFK